MVCVAEVNCQGLGCDGCVDVDVGVRWVGLVGVGGGVGGLLLCWVLSRATWGTIGWWRSVVVMDGLLYVGEATWEVTSFSKRGL